MHWRLRVTRAKESPVKSEVLTLILILLSNAILIRRYAPALWCNPRRVIFVPDQY